MRKRRQLYVEFFFFSCLLLLGIYYNRNLLTTSSHTQFEIMSVFNSINFTRLTNLNKLYFAISILQIESFNRIECNKCFSVVCFPLNETKFDNVKCYYSYRFIENSNNCIRSSQVSIEYISFCFC